VPKVVHRQKQKLKNSKARAKEVSVRAKAKVDPETAVLGVFTSRLLDVCSLVPKLLIRQPSTTSTPN